MAAILYSMFTGIVERTVAVASVAEGTGFVRLNLAAAAFWPDVKLGDSVAVNGVCLTVADISPPSIGFDVIPETLRKTNLGLLAARDVVNAERSLRAGDRIDGHFVQGHVDATGKLVDQIAHDKEWKLTIHPPAELMKYIIPRGSIAIDGVSLTIANVARDRFDVALIPTTVKLTTLGSRPVGWEFNLEADILAKTIVANLERMRG
jgi:riboflavin synthase